MKRHLYCMKSSMLGWSCACIRVFVCLEPWFFLFSLFPSIFFICCFVWNARCFYLLDRSLQQHKYYAKKASVLFIKLFWSCRNLKFQFFFVLTFFMRILTPHCFELFYPGTSLHVVRKVFIGKISVYRLFMFLCFVTHFNFMSKCCRNCLTKLLLKRLTNFYILLLRSWGISWYISHNAHSLLLLVPPQEKAIWIHFL
jgi:hypothetical protein